MVTLGGQSVMIPAAVYRAEDGGLVCGEAAVRRSLTEPGRVAVGFKRRLGDPIPVCLGGEFVPTTHLLAALLREVVGSVTRTEGSPPDRVVLTQPASWGPYRRGLFEEVPELAGLAEGPMVTEPAAAAIHYARNRRLSEGQTVAVYDLGGGTFDVTVLRAHPERCEIVGVPEGIERLGGLDFDEALYAHVDHETDGALSTLDAREPRVASALARVRQDCARAKEILSHDNDTVIPIFLPDRNLEIGISRERFESLIRAHIESTIGALERTLRSARLGPEDIDAVLLVGGSSRIPLVARMVAEALGRPTLLDTHPKYAVALGAAVLADRSAPLPPVARRPADAHRSSAPPPGAVAPSPPAAPAMPAGGSAGGSAAPPAPPSASQPSVGDSGVAAVPVLELTVENRRIAVPPDRPFVIGRGEEVQLALTNPLVSRRHAVLEHVDGGWLLTDSSLNGTFADGVRVTRLSVSRRTRLVLGARTDGVEIDLIPRIPPPAAGPVYALGSPTDGDTNRKGRLTAVHSLAGGRLLRIGRSPENDVVLDDMLVSRRHAELRSTGAAWELIDLSSGNGTFVNGRRVDSSPITPHDVIGVGNSLLQLDGDRLVECLAVATTSVIGGPAPHVAATVDG